MRSFVLALLFLTVQLSQAQDSIKRLEFGSTLLTVNSLKSAGYFRQDRPSMEYLNGLFLRYNIKKIALRASLSFSKNHTSYKAPLKCRDCESGEVDNRDFRAGIGFQASLLQKKNWFYAFVDLSYRNLFSSGTYVGGIGGWASTVISSSNGVDAFYGAGLKIRTIKRIYLTPEFGYNVYVGYTKTTMTDKFSLKKTITEGKDIRANCMAKLHLTLLF